MSLDLFAELNSLRTNPTAYTATVSGPAQTITSTYTTQTAWVWSNSLMRAALKYVNDKGGDGSAAESSAFLTGRNIYLSTACDNYEFELTSTLNSQALWNAHTQMDTWLSAGYFNNANLKGTLYNKVGIACSCDYLAEARCVFLFSSYMIGNDVTDKVP